MRLLSIFALALLAQVALGLVPARAERLVLVSSTATPVTLLTPAEARKVFLGRPLVKDGVRLEALRNTSDALLQEVFLQKVVFMSERAYERQLLSTVFREGGERPVDYANPQQLLTALQNRSGALTYMWEPEARTTSGIKIVGELWEGTLE